jgi:hypothetical protein
MRALPVRLLTVCLLAAPISLATLPFAGSAGSAGSAGDASRATCSAVSGMITGTDQLTGCTENTTGGSGRIKSTGNLIDTVRWENGGKTIFKITGGPTTKRNPCPPGTFVVKLRGEVTRSTGEANDISGRVSATACLAMNGSSVSLAPGTVWRF